MIVIYIGVLFVGVYVILTNVYKEMNSGDIIIDIRYVVPSIVAMVVSLILMVQRIIG